MTENYTGPLPSGWSGGEALTKWWRGKIVHLYTLRKPCAQCHREMRIDVTRAALEGTAKNAGLHLTRCAECRAETKAAGASSRPAIVDENIEALRAANATMREELDGLYALNQELRDALSKHETRMPWELK